MYRMYIPKRLQIMGRRRYISKSARKKTGAVSNPLPYVWTVRLVRLQAMAVELQYVWFACPEFVQHNESYSEYQILPRAEVKVPAATSWNGSDFAQTLVSQLLASVTLTHLNPKRRWFYNVLQWVFPMKLVEFSEFCSAYI